jgi:hypothetical protein
MTEINFFGIWNIEKGAWLGHSIWTLKGATVPRRFAFKFEAEACLRHDLLHSADWRVRPFSEANPFAKTELLASELAMKVDNRLALRRGYNV